MKKSTADSAWINAALDYLPQWLDLQLERYRQPGCSVAIARGGETVAELALGVADMRTHQPLTPRHRLRIASHSKTFTAAGVMLLREQGKVGLDDPIGRYVDGLHKDLAGARIGELLSHSAGVTRDGPDAGQFLDRRPYLSRAELLADLRAKPPLEAGVQLKYSNHGYGLLGLMMEQVTGTDYASWMQRHVIAAAGLEETAPDMPHLPRRAPLAVGHSSEFPFGQRLIVPGDNPCDAMPRRMWPASFRSWRRTARTASSRSPAAARWRSAAGATPATCSSPTTGWAPCSARQARANGWATRAACRGFCRARRATPRWT